MSGVRKICTNCGFVGEESSRADPDAVRILLVLVLFVFFVIPGIVYLIYLSRGSRMCPACHTRNMIPIDTPLGQKLLGEIGQKQTLTVPRFRNKAEYEAWKTAKDARGRR